MKFPIKSPACPNREPTADELAVLESVVQAVASIYLPKIKAAEDEMAKARLAYGLGHGFEDVDRAIDNNEIPGYHEANERRNDLESEHESVRDDSIFLVALRIGMRLGGAVALAASIPEADSAPFPSQEAGLKALALAMIDDSAADLLTLRLGKFYGLGAFPGAGEIRNAVAAALEKGGAQA